MKVSNLLAAAGAIVTLSAGAALAAEGCECCKDMAADAAMSVLRRDEDRARPARADRRPPRRRRIRPRLRATPTTTDRRIDGFRRFPVGEPPDASVLDKADQVSVRVDERADPQSRLLKLRRVQAGVAPAGFRQS